MFSIRSAFATDVPPNLSTRMCHLLLPFLVQKKSPHSHCAGFFVISDMRQPAPPVVMVVVVIIIMVRLWLRMGFLSVICLVNPITVKGKAGWCQIILQICPQNQTIWIWSHIRIKRNYGKLTRLSSHQPAFNFTEPGVSVFFHFYHAGCVFRCLPGRKMYNNQTSQI